MPNPWFALTDHRMLALTGRDAIAFAQSQFMNDVKALDDGIWQLNGWLTAKGRVIALFALLRIDADTLWLVLPDASAEDMVRQLQRFVFRSKVMITARDDLDVVGQLCASQQASGNHWAGDPASCIDLDLSGDGGGRALRIGSSIGAAVDAEAQLQWKKLDLIHGWPRLGTEQREQWTPQQLSLERLGAFSVKKGCYPGQEIVARTHFLGKAKRELALVHLNGAFSPGSELKSDHPHNDNQVTGVVVSVAGETALAVVSLDVDHPAAENQSPASGGALWKKQILLGGLQR